MPISELYRAGIGTVGTSAGGISGFGPQRRVRVLRPITPCRAGEAVLKEHANDGHHRETAVRDLGIQALLRDLRIVARQQRRFETASTRGGLPFLVKTNTVLAEEAVGKDLEPAKTRHLRNGCEAVGDVL